MPQEAQAISNVCADVRVVYYDSRLISKGRLFREDWLRGEQDYCSNTTEIQLDSPSPKLKALKLKTQSDIN